MGRLVSNAIYDHIWIVGGDFNTILSVDEHKGSTSPNLADIKDFKDCLKAIPLINTHTTGGTYTWDGVRSRGRVWRRLDRALINEKALTFFSDIFSQMCSKTTSDHKPIVLQCALDSFNELRKAETNALVAQVAYEANPDDPTLRSIANEAYAKLIEATNREAIFWKQKANLHWMEHGDQNSTFFHSFVKGRRTNLKIRAIKDQDGKLIEKEDDIKRAAEKHFFDTFNNSKLVDAEQILHHIPHLISNDDNTMMSSIPDEMEVRKAVWDLNPNSAAGPDGFNDYFFRICWDIVKQDVIKARQEFFMGLHVPQAYGSTLITLIPKKEHCTTFSEFRPISLSTFMSVLSKYGFSTRVQNLLLANLEAISILINGSPTGFFKIKRGVKQGDPLSPLLFILANEVFSRMLHHFFDIHHLKNYNTGKSTLVSHLAYADDLIIFLNGRVRNLLRFKHILEDYTQGSGQEVNYNKSSFFASKHSSPSTITRMAKALNMTHEKMPFKYLGVTICKGKLKKDHCQAMRPL
ncbi:unnamed protein product [Cuscuta campestris]|uniref:Reverse transcriptase domain-containing protein n=1 Tax=Cuscuta campestris TaxID=132261 RepID=A0A484LSW6_9ASTE|nr:unnamed protein product [Cuscuta campestris]